MNLQAGVVVGNKIRIIRPLKRGGMGSVWVAEHQTLRMQVAVKFMAERLVQDHEYVERFAREAMSSAQIKSPHVVQVFDHGVFDGTPFIVMELLDGEDMRTRIARAGPISVAEAGHILVQLSRALTKAHAAGIVHRDIKPDNIFLMEHDGEPFIKVLDFGVAKHAAQDAEHDMTGTGAMVGTPHYMSPEQILSARRVDHRADLWSVGVVMYRALTGSVPFQGETLGAVCVAIERAEFTPATQRRPDLPPTLDVWFARALAREPAQRFQSAKEMAEAFVAASETGGHAMAAFYRPDTSFQGGPMPGVPAGFSAPPPAVAPSNPWGTNQTNLSVPVEHAHRVSSANLPAPTPPLVAGSSAPQASATSWPSYDDAQQGPHLQTFPGSSVTHAERRDSSRKTLIAIVVGASSLLLLVVGLLVALVMDDAPTATPIAVASQPPAPTALAPAPPVATAEPAPPSAPTASATPVVAVSTKAPPPPNTAPAVVKPNPTVKPRRDRGF